MLEDSLFLDWSMAAAGFASPILGLAVNISMAAAWDGTIDQAYVVVGSSRGVDFFL